MDKIISTLEEKCKKRDAYTQEEVDQINKDLNDSIKEYEQLSLSKVLSPASRFLVLKSFVKMVSDCGYDTIAKLRDCITFVKDEKERDDIITLLSLISNSNAFTAHERTLNANTFYNQGMIDICYDSFSSIASDESVLVGYRADACKFLFGSGDEEYKEFSNDILKELIDIQSYPSSYRYKIIASYISKCGIKTFLNALSIHVPYEEEFVYPLQNIFFWNDKNDIRDIIFSGTHLLQIEINSDKEKVCDKLLSISLNKENDIRVRAASADALKREGINKEYIDKASSVIENIGYSNIGKGDILSAVKTFYNNEENAHNAVKYIEPFIEKSKQKYKKLLDFEDVHSKIIHIINMKYKSNVNEEDIIKKDKCYKSLDRISIDSSTFTKFKVSLIEILIHTFMNILEKDESVRDTLYDRLINELEDMEDTCSSGYGARLVNVLSEFETSLIIDWSDQVSSNILGRLNARIKNIKDEDLKGDVFMGMTENAEENERKAYLDFISSQKDELYIELKKEFVDDEYISLSDFEKYFENTFSKILN